MPTFTASTHRGITKTALIASIAIGLIGAGIVIIAFRAPAPEEPISESDTAQLNRPSIADIDESSLDSLDSTGAASAARITLIDKDDPTRTAWDIEADGFEPIENSDLVHTDRPRGWIYLDPARPAYFRADEATFRIESFGQEPESGEFVGAVEILLYEGPKDTIDRDKPAVRINTDSLVFDALRGQLTTDDTITIKSAEIDATLHGLRAIFSERDQTLESAESTGGGQITYAPHTSPHTSHTPPSQTPARATSQKHVQAPSFALVSAHQPETEPQTAPAPTYYDGLITRDVRLTQDTRTVTADRLALSGRLLDGSLAPDAIREIAARSWRHTIAAMIIATQPEPSSEPDTNPDTVHLTWTGTLRIDRVDHRPEVLEGDELAARFEATKDTPVAFEDVSIDAHGTCETLRYGLTLARVRLTGSERHPLVATSDAAGALRARDLELALSTGVGTVRGQGQLATTDGTDRSISWQDQGDFILATGERGPTGNLESASFSGDVRLRDPRLAIDGDSLRTSFDPSAEGAGALRRAVISGSAHARATTGELAADEIEVAFKDTGADEPMPTSVRAAGNVIATKSDTTVTGAALEADLVTVEGKPDPDVELAVVRGDSSTPAQFRRDDGTFAIGQVLRTRALERTSEITGEPAVVGNPSGRITAGTIALREDRDEVEVTGPGTFERISDGSESAEATWTRSMLYVGAQDRLEIRGDARLSAARSATSTDTLEADVVLAEFLPGETDEPETSSGRLRTLTAQGSDEAPATLEAVRRPEPGAEPDRALLLQGARIEADNEQARLRVPSPGRLLVADLREGDLEEPESLDARGAALFDWTGSMSFDRSDSRIVMRRGVSMIRKDPAGDPEQTTSLLAEKLTARIADENPDAALTDETSGATLERVLAEGAVWLRRGERELTADRVDYDAMSQAARAESPFSGWVTLFDAREGRDVNAEGVRWDLAGDRIELVGPQPVVTPN